MPVRELREGVIIYLSVWYKYDRERSTGSLLYFSSDNLNTITLLGRLSTLKGDNEHKLFIRVNEVASLKCTVTFYLDSVEEFRVVVMSSEEMAELQRREKWIGITTDLQRRAYEFFKDKYIVKGAYTLSLQLAEQGRPTRKTMDVDFVAKKIDKKKLISEVNQFAETLNDYVGITWREESKTVKKDFCISALFLYEGRPVFNLDIGEGSIKDDDIVNDQISVIRTLADKIALVLGGHKLKKRPRDVIDIARIATWYKGTIRLSELVRLIRYRQEKDNLDMDTTFFTERQREVIQLLKDVPNVDVDSMTEVYKVAFDFMAPILMESYGDDLIWNNKLGKWVEG